MAEPLDMRPKVPAQGLKPLDITGRNVLGIDPELAQKLAGQYDFALGPDSPGPRDLYLQIMKGADETIRRHAARQSDIRKAGIRDELFKLSLGADQTDAELIDSFSFDTVSMPETVMEEKFAKRVLSETYTALDDGTGVQSRAYEENPDVADGLRDQAERNIAMNMYAQNVLGKLQAQHEKLPWYDKTIQFLGPMIPFVTQYHLHDAVRPPYPTSFFTGKNNREQFLYLRSLSLPKFSDVFAKGVEEIASVNVNEAMMFVQSFIQYGASQEFLDNSINALDVATLLSPAAKAGARVGKGVVKGAKASVPGRTSLKETTEFSESLKETVKAVNPDNPDVGEVAAAAGRSDAYAAHHFVEEAKTEFYKNDPNHLAASLLRNIPSFMDPGKFFRGASKLGREYGSRVTEQANLALATILRSFGGQHGITSLAPDALEEAFRIGRDRLKDEAKRASVNEAIIDIDQVIRPEENLGNVAFNVMRLGRPDGSFFPNKSAAEGYKKIYNIKGLEAKGAGDQWHLELKRVVDETRPEVKDFIVDSLNQTPRSTFTTFLEGISSGLSKLRTPSELLSEGQRGMRASAIQRIPEVSRLIKAAGEPILRLDKASKIRLERFLDAARRFEDVLEDGTRVKGIEFHTMGQFEVSWMDLFNRLPSEAETQAYMSYKQLNQYDWVLRNLQIYHWKARQGVRNWQFKGNEGYKEGRLVNKMDWDGPGNIMVIQKGAKKDPIYVARLRKSKTESRDEIQKLIDEEGYQVVQMVDPFEFDSRAPVHFVVAKPTATKNLEYVQIPYRGGGHIRYDYGYHMKQARLAKGGDEVLYHTGDHSLMGVTSRAEAHELEQGFEKARDLFKNGTEADFKAWVSSNLPVDAEKLFQMLKNRTIDPDTPIVAVRSGESAMKSPVMQKLHQGEFTSWNDSDLNLLKGMNFEYAGKRNWDPGLEEDPTFALVRPRLVDPLGTISTALNHVIRNKFLQPYKLRSAEHFVEEFHPVLKDGYANLERFRENPMAVLNNPIWDNNAADRKLLAAARGYQRSASSLVGTSTEWGRWQNWLEGKLLDSVYTKFGPKAADRYYETILPKIPDPIQFARQVAFHTKLGLFNPVQLWLQAQTFTITVGIAGVKHGSSGVAAGSLMRMLHFADNPKNIDHFASMASKMGWKADEFKEAYQFMKDSGVFNIGPQHVWRSDNLDPNIFRSAVGTYLDKGLLFFNEGERFNHLVGFATAYREWRAANPFAKLTRDAQEAILARYDDLTINMTHASSSALNRGLGAVAGQFWSFQTRLLELMWGGRLSKMDKLRAFTIMSLMYGVPVAGAAFTAGAESLAGIVPGVPVPEELRVGTFYEDVRAELLKRGIESNAFIEAMSEGLPELMLHIILGEQYNYGQRLGPSGLPIWDDLARQDSSIFDILLGAPGSILGDIFRTSAPAVMGMADLISDDPKSTPKSTLTDYLELFSNASSINNAMKAYFALTAQSYYNTGKLLIDDEVTTMEGFMMAMTGLTPSRITDRLVMEQAVQGRTDAQTYARKEALKYLRLAWREEDPATAKAYRERARLYMDAGNFTIGEKGDIVSQAITAGETDVEVKARRFREEFQ